MDFTSKILFNSWKLQPTDKEFTVMRIALKGTQNGKLKYVEYNLYDEYDVETGISSMARTTGYTATAAVNLIANNLFSDKGVFPPEFVGKHKVCFDFILKYLAERNIIYRLTEN